jgi:redox-sensitive bicupin YhaK (pirin superfamily)
MEAFTGHHSPNGRDVSPFLLMHDFGEPSKLLDTLVADDPGPPQERAEKIVGWHPHRGFDIITYMKEGRGSHADSLGNQAVVRPGGIQWLRCGSGIEHAEGGGNPEHANTHV